MAHMTQVIIASPQTLDDSKTLECVGYSDDGSILWHVSGMFS